MSGSRPETWPGRGAGLTLGDVTPGSMGTSGVPGATKFVSWEASSILHAHLEGCYEEAGPPRMALFGLSVVKRVQPIRTLGRKLLGVGLDPSLGWA